MELCVDCGTFGKMFGVPNELVDRYLKEADEIQIKVMLLFMRYSGQNISYVQAASFLNITEEQVSDAMEYWKKTTLFGEKKKIVKKVNVEKNTPRDSIVSPKVLSKMTEESKELNDLMLMLEKSLDKEITNAERQSIYYMYSELKLEPAAIAILCKYCASINKMNLKYITKIADSWSNKGITSLKGATDEISKMTEKRNYRAHIYRIFNLKNPMTPLQLEYVDKWQKKAYSSELLERAYHNAIDRINQVNFKYINTTLENWEKAGVKDISDLEKISVTNKSTDKIDADLEKYKELANYFGDIKNGK